MRERELTLDSKEFEKPHENCAVIGVFSRSVDVDVAQVALNGLKALNHRGQESAGIAVANGKDPIKVAKDLGLAEIVFALKQKLPDLPDAFVAVGHDRYSTSGGLADSQPFQQNGIVIAHNGNLTNAEYLRQEYRIPEELDGARSDSRIALAVINKMSGNEQEKIIAGIKKLEGAYSLVLATKNVLFASRDPLGFHPLSLGKLENGNGFIIASETAAFDSMKAEFIRDILPGETIMITDEGVRTIALNKRTKLAQCIFELIYFSRPDSVVFGIPVMNFRLREGEILAQHMPDVDMIMPVPRSGIAAAIGVAASETAKLKGAPYKEGLYTNPYQGLIDGARTFIRPNGRDKAATEKYTANAAVLKGKRIAVVEDSIVRGSLRLVVKKLRRAGASEVHGLIASPPLRSACWYGTDMSSDELLANRIPDFYQRRQYLDLDSLYHLSYSEVVYAALGNKMRGNDNSKTIFEENGFCGGCFTGRYPTKVEGTILKTVYEK